MRVIITRDGPLPELIEFFSTPLNRRRSLSWQRKVAESVGLMFDYLTAQPLSDQHQGGLTYLSGFVDAMREGTVQADGSDGTDLGWRPMTPAKIQSVVRYVTLFSDHCAYKYDTQLLNDYHRSSVAERLAHLRRIDKKNQHSLFLHLKQSGVDADRSRTHSGRSRSFADAYARGELTRDVTVDPPPIVHERAPRHFPMDRFSDLLNIGFCRERVPSGRPPWERWNVRDMMMVLLQAHGGLRSCEPLHLFMRDVIDNGAGIADVRVFHPTDGLIKVLDSVTGGVGVVTRREFLRMRYGMSARSEMHSSLRAGWKTPALDDDKNWKFMQVHWFPSEAGALFWQLFQWYRDHVRPSAAKHPFLFCTHHAPYVGSPYRLRAYYRNLNAATAKLGLNLGQEVASTSHSLRHAYGQVLRRARLTPKEIMVCMHHKSVTSQDVYTLPGSGEIDAALRRGEAFQREAGILPTISWTLLNSHA